MWATTAVEVDIAEFLDHPFSTVATVSKFYPVHRSFIPERVCGLARGGVCGVVCGGGPTCGGVLFCTIICGGGI